MRLHRTWEEAPGLDTHLGSGRPEALCPEDRSRDESAWNDAVLDITTEWKVDELVCSTSEQSWIALPLMISERPNGALRSAFNTPRDVRDGGVGLPCSTVNPTPRSGSAPTGNTTNSSHNPVTPWPFVPMDRLRSVNGLSMSDSTNCPSGVDGSFGGRG